VKFMVPLRTPVWVGLNCTLTLLTKWPRLRQSESHPRASACWRSPAGCSRCYSLAPMQGPVKERWRQLCEQPTVEQDPTKLLELAQQINELLEEKEPRLLGKSSNPSSTT
jgi:hypothetical protein